MIVRFPSALRQHLAALRMLLVFTVVTGLVYPLAVTGIARLAFPRQADGSLIKDHGRPVASALIGQNFALPQHKAGEPPQPDPKWFQPRPSAADLGQGAGPYDATDSNASNLGPDNSTLLTQIHDRRAAVAAFDGVDPKSVPADALTASGSGLDPDISPAYAYEQTTRVARARGLDPKRVAQLVRAHVRDRDLGFLGQERVNVVDLNHDLAGLS
ncbi:potassium-transporting ATPase subunit KdpC [Streptomyces gamaensis]|uniref:Potassium-transporting ATPase KdpC subunit n=1 Tax=Streptomyces gamaensis TaxID=1763542 RepID=A0ABW0YVZ1_9ACTN